MFTPPAEPVSEDPARMKRIHRERAMEHTVSLANTSVGMKRGPGYTAAELVSYADVIAKYLDDAIVPEVDEND